MRVVGSVGEGGWWVKVVGSVGEGGVRALSCNVLVCTVLALKTRNIQCTKIPSFY